MAERQTTIATTAGRHTGAYRPATTLPDHRQHPAAALVTPYHQRWEIETAHLEPKSTIPGGRVPRARSPAGTAQEPGALQARYQIVRIAITDAIQAAGVIPGTTAGLTGAIGRRVPDNLQPGRRLRASPPNRQTRDLQLPGHRPQHQPAQLQNHPQHQHPRCSRPLTDPPGR